MAVEKGDRQLVVTVDAQNICDADKQAAIPHSVPSAQFCDTQVPALTRLQRFMRGIAHHLHIATFLPLVLISALRSINNMVAAVVCTTVVLCILFLSFCAYKAGYVQIFPKPYDLFNLSLYGSMVVLSLCAHDWLLTYIGLLTNGGNAIFMWVTILLPCMDNFVMHTVKDRVAPELVHHPLIRRMALLIALSWATALVIMTAGSIIPIALANLHIKPYPATIIATHVLGFAPLVLAVVVQHIISFVYRKKIRSQCITPVLQKQHEGALQVTATQAHAAQAAEQPKDQSARGIAGDNAV